MDLKAFQIPEEAQPSANINVTSLVDVTLIILIIFILIAPIMEQGITLNLPKATADKIKTKEALTIEVNDLGQIFLDQMPVSLQEFQLRIKSIAQFNKDQSILIRADQKNNYGRIIAVIDSIKASGLSKIGLLTQPKGKQK